MTLMVKGLMMMMMMTLNFKNPHHIQACLGDWRLAGGGGGELRKGGRGLKTG